MSATNTTTNYSLPIFAGSDIPSWLTDWNGAMRAIDEAIANALTEANTANADVKVAESAIAQLKSSLDTLAPIVEESADNLTTLETNYRTLNSTVEQIRSDVEVLQNNNGAIYAGTLSAGESTLTLTVSNLSENSMIDVYTDKFGVSPTLIETDVAAHTIKLTFPLLSDLLKVKVKVGE